MTRSLLVRRGVVGAVLIAVCALVGLVGWGQQDESFVADISGRKTWTIRYGFGHPLGLAAAGLSAGQVSLDQTLAVDLRAEALSILTVEGHFNDQEPEGMQSLTVYLDTDRLDGVFGDFTIQASDAFTAYRRKVKGARLDYSIGPSSLSAFASRLEGISESRTFLGETAASEVLYTAALRDRPWAEQPYTRHIEGLYAYPLDSRYIEEFTDVVLSVAGTDGLRNVLLRYGLDYLFEIFVDEPDAQLDERQFTVIGDAPQTLLLNSALSALLRDRLGSVFKTYNEKHDLSGADAKAYPFSTGSDYEVAFLDDIADVARLVVDGEAHPLASAERRRFYSLGRTDIVEESVAVEVSLDGELFTSIAHPEFVEYGTKLYAEEGIIELRFPEVFFGQPDRAVRVSFSYTVAGGTYTLGFAIIPGSDRVTVNEQLLVRDTDYTIDYEIGLLIVLVETSEDDLIRVDYERFSGGLGGTAEYARYFRGVSLDLPLSQAIELEAHWLQAFDDPGSPSNPEAVRTMPNRQTIAGVAGSITLEAFSADFAVAYAVDRFPLDDNRRDPYPNEIAAIAAAGSFVFFGHSAGLSVAVDETWQAYGTAGGLSGRAVRTMAVDTGSDTVYVGTNAGLTVVSLVGLSPLDRVRNWARYYEEDGLPDGSIRALAIHHEALWIGTDSGLACVPLDALDDRSSWTAYTEGRFAELGPIRALVGQGEVLYLGTDTGLFRFEPPGGEPTLVLGTATLRIAALLLVDGALYVASDQGLRTFRDGVGTGWLVLGTPIHALITHEDSVYYGTDDGLVRTSDGARFHDGWVITALANAEDGTLWIGSRADRAYTLMIWRHGATQEAYGNTITKIDGRDPFRFVDVPADAHTVRGILGRASFQRTGESGSLSGWVDVASPGYRPIGGGSRSGGIGWELNGTAKILGDATVSASHGYRTGGLAGGEARMENSASFSGTFGPDVSLSLQHECTNTDSSRRGAETSFLSYRVSLDDRLFDEVLRLAIAWSDAHTENREYALSQRDRQLSSQVDLVFSPGLSVGVGWVRPIRVRGDTWTGSERWTLAGSWAQRLLAGDASLSYELDRSRALPSGSFAVAHIAELEFDWDSFDTGEWQLTPGIDVTVQHEMDATSLSGTATLRSAWGPLLARTTVGGEMSGLGEPLQRRAAKLTTTLNYSGLESLKPSVTYSANRRTTRYQGVGTVISTEHSLSGRMTWSSEEGAHDSLSVSLRIRGDEEQRQVTGTIDNTYEFDLSRRLASWLTEEEESQDDAREGIYPTLGVRIETRGEYRHDQAGTDLSSSLTASGDLALSPTWSGSVSASYLLGTLSEGGLRHTLLLELTVAADF